MTTVGGVPSDTGSFLTWLYSGPFGTSPWQRSCDKEASDVACERSPGEAGHCPATNPQPAHGVPARQI